MTAKGLSVHRLRDNPEEKRFAEAWAAWNRGGPGGRTTLAYLLDSRQEHTGHPPEPDVRDQIVAATVVQWLGSPVGQDFLEALGYKRVP